ncbi:MAG: histidine phosphatase family protein [Bacteroidetes bacterium]|nr:histidine phosphatase family protein [Bacteroidota bacterium]MBS1757606.1 histidine phosphatase family protein [Bacteroidota bacterium]
MKSLFIIRHAKSNWADFGKTDFERELNERGKKDAPEMAKRLIEKKIVIDTFVSSPAIRAKNTCQAFCKAYHTNTDNIIFFDSLYHATVEDFYSVLSSLNKIHNRVAVFSHNPGITSFVNTLIKEVHIDNMPTCAVFAVNINTDGWSNLRQAEKNFLFFDYPKL